MLNISLPERPGGFNPTEPRLRRPAGPGRHRIRVLCAMGSNMRLKFTKANIEALEPPPQGEIFAWSSDKPGWGVRILASGRKSWIVQFRDASGKSRRHTLGDLRILPIGMAEARASELLSHARIGRDLLAEEKARRERKATDAKKSVGAMVAAYLAEPEVRRRRSFPEIQRYLSAVWKPIHADSAEEIGVDRLRPELRKIAAERGEVTANRARAALSSMFIYSIRAGWLRRGDSPTTHLPRWEEHSRERVLSLEELGAVWKAAPEVNEQFGRIIRLLALTGARRGEIAGLMWNEIDLDRALISLPASRVKSNRPVTIPLSTAAAAILEATPRLSSVVTFPGFGGWSHAKKALDARVKLDQPWTIHDIRRSCRSLWIDGEHGLGLDLHLCEQLLGHALPGIIGVYDKGSRLVERRRALERWADLVLRAAGEPVGDAKIVNLR